MGEGAPSDKAQTRVDESLDEPEELQLRARVEGRLFGDSPEPVKIGRYVVLERIGTGGLGVVYSAYDPELDRKVAVKLLKPSALDRTASAATRQKRLLREAQAMAKLDHPNVVAVHDAGTLGERVFIAMDLVEGSTLREFVARREPSWHEVRDLLCGAGRGLVAAHDAGLVHRDFKPANVLIGPDLRPRVLDFGLARLVSPDDSLDRGEGAELDGDLPIDEEGDTASWDQKLTRTGTVMGTPAYMAPEQYRSEHVDARADQFSFCVSAFEMLFGKRPFEGADVKTLMNAIEAGQTVEPKGPARAPGWLRRVIVVGLHADPERRHASMRELLGALERDKRSRKRWFMAIGATAIASALAAASLASFVRPEPTEAERSVVDELTELARAAAARSSFVYPPSNKPAEPTAYTVVVELEAVEGTAQGLAAARALELRAEFAATLVRLGDKYWEREGGRGFATDYYSAALMFSPTNDHARSRSQLTPGELAVLRQKATDHSFEDSELAGADALAALADPDAKERKKKVKALYRNKRKPSVSTSVHLERLLGEAVVPQSKQADKDQQKALTEDRRPPATDAAKTSAKQDPAAAKKRVVEARTAYRAGRWAEAEKLFHQALRDDRRSHKALSGLTELHFERGDYKKAVDFAKRATRAAPKVGRYQIQLGDAYFKVLQYDDARKAYDTAKRLKDPAATARIRRLERKLGG